MYSLGFPQSCSVWQHRSQAVCQGHCHAGFGSRILCVPVHQRHRISVQDSELGENKGGKKLVDGFWEYVEPDRSVVILLYGVCSIVICVAFVGLWILSVRAAYKSQVQMQENGKAPSFMDDVHELLDAKAHLLLMFLPTLGYCGLHRAAVDLHDLHGIHQL